MDDLWRLSGECMVGFARRTRGWHSGLPSALSPLPGPIAIIGVRYDASPVGPYLELSVAEPARLGLRTGLCVTTMAVTSPAARTLCRQRWELPTEVAALTWLEDGEERCLVWEEREFVLRGRPHGPWLPVIVPMRSLQAGSSGPLVVPRRMRARLRMAGVVVEAPQDGSLAPLAGRHPGLMSGALSMVAHPPRRPTGLLSSIPLRVPKLAPGPEPAGLTTTMASFGRMAQLVRAQPSHG